MPRAGGLGPHRRVQLVEDQHKAEAALQHSDAWEPSDEPEDELCIVLGVPYTSLMKRNLRRREDVLENAPDLGDGDAEYPSCAGSHPY